MSLRTYRRVSPRTRRRYRAIRNFFRRTLSSLTSHSAIRINSSIAVNDTELKHRTVGLKRQNHCDQDVGNYSRKEIEESVQSRETAVLSKKQRRRLSSGDLEEAETKVLYRKPDHLCSTSHEFIYKLNNDLSDRGHNSSIAERMNSDQFASYRHPTRKPKMNRHDNDYENLNGQRSRFREQRTHMIVENSENGLGSCESLLHQMHFGDQDPSGLYSSSQQQEYDRYIQPEEVKIKKCKNKTKCYKSKSPSRQEESGRKKSKKKPPPSGNNMDPRFISEIINRQYKPVSFFGRRASDFSRISTPVCRDQVYSARGPMMTDSEETTYRMHAPRYRYSCAADVSDMRSVCDTRLYSAQRPAHVHRRRHHVDDYNDSSLYDVVPVKEKSSPKSRRKFIEDHLILAEVPPSPRTQRPRLNLETQNYGDGEDYERRARSRKRSPSRRRRFVDSYRQDFSSEESQNNNNRSTPRYVMRTKNTTRLSDDIGTTMSSQHYLAFPNNIANATLDNTRTHNGDEALGADKTDKALSEIKNILQSFLRELKKDSSTSQSDETSRTTNKDGEKQLDDTPRGSGNGTSNAMKNSAASSFDCGPAAQFMPGIANPCCYPRMMPYGPHGAPCLHNRCLMASPSCVCACMGYGHIYQGTDTHGEPCRTCSKVNCTAEADGTKKDCETDELIREIYNYVSRNSSIGKQGSPRNSVHQFGQAGRHAVAEAAMPCANKSMHALRQDANVGTPQLRCYSKSCEAIASQYQFDSYYAPNSCYSDSLLDKRSQEAMDYEIPDDSNDYTFIDKKKLNNSTKQSTHSSKFASAFRLIRKKTRKENIQEVCQSEQSIEVDVIPKMRPHHKQEFATYAMHGQQYLHPPPAPQQRHPPPGPQQRYPPSAPQQRYQPPCAPPRMEYDYPQYDPRLTRYSNSEHVNDRYDPHYDCMSPSQPGPMYDNPYEPQYRDPMQPQVPLCLKEVEVRSMGTQSEKPSSYFRIFSQLKKQPPESPEPQRAPPVSILRNDRRTDPSQTFQDNFPTKPRKHLNLNLKTPDKPPPKEVKPTLSERIQKDIEKNNPSANANSAILKKMFHKRNPFSPQNRFVRTIMEKDAPVVKWRPRLFI